MRIFHKVPSMVPSDACLYNKDLSRALDHNLVPAGMGNSKSIPEFLMLLNIAHNLRHCEHGKMAIRTIDDDAGTVMLISDPYFHQNTYCSLDSSLNPAVQLQALHSSSLIPCLTE